jgi:hypothetical protein
MYSTAGCLLYCLCFSTVQEIKILSTDSRHYAFLPIPHEKGKIPLCVDLSLFVKYDLLIVIIIRPVFQYCKYFTPVS